MKWHQKIKAFFFLCIISILMLHNSMPHVHHEHESSAENDQHGGHHHDHDHHTTDEQPSEDDGKGFLYHFFLGIHAHTFHTHEFNTSTKYEVQAARDKIKPLIALFENGDVSPPSKEQNPHWHPAFKESFFDDPILLYCSLRAPPSLS